jgi:hypothetical protein
VQSGGCIIAASHFDLPFSFTEIVTLNPPAELAEDMV